MPSQNIYPQGVNTAFHTKNLPDNYQNKPQIQGMLTNPHGLNSQKFANLPTFDFSSKTGKLRGHEEIPRFARLI